MTFKPHGIKAAAGVVPWLQKVGTTLLPSLAAFFFANAVGSVIDISSQQADVGRMCPSWWRRFYIPPLQSPAAHVRTSSRRKSATVFLNAPNNKRRSLKMLLRRMRSWESSLLTTIADENLSDMTQTKIMFMCIKPLFMLCIVTFASVSAEVAAARGCKGDMTPLTGNQMKLTAFWIKLWISLCSNIVGNMRWNGYTNLKTFFCKCSQVRDTA